MDIFYVVSCWVCIAYIFLGLYIFKADRKRGLNRFFLLFNCMLASASVCNLFMYVSRGKPSYSFWYAGAVLSWCVYTGLIVNLSYIITKKVVLPGSWRIYALLYLPIPVIMAFELFFLRDFYKNNFTAYVAVIIFEYLYLFGYPVAALANIWAWGRRSKRLREKKQAALIVTAGFITLILSLLVTLSIYVFKANALPDLTHIFNFFFDLALYYAIHRYRLISLKALVSAENVIAKVTDLIFIIDGEGRIAGINGSCEELLGYRPEELRGRPIGHIIGSWEEAAASERPAPEAEAHYNCITAFGRIIPVSVRVSEVFDAAGEKVGSVVICKDMTLVRELQNEIEERKEKEDRLNYLSFHDSLTGLFNRRCFEQEMIRIEGGVYGACGIVICDVDGLKFVNDTMGHKAGDLLLIKAAEIIRKAFGPSGTVFRIGGDEFAVLLPDTDAAFIKGAEREVKHLVRSYNAANNDFYMSISIGYAVKGVSGNDILETFKEADNNMYREKLNHIKSTRSSMIQGLVKLLEVRDFITEGHGDRMKELVVELGEHIGLPERKIMDLRLLAQFHDIGKVGIPDRVLFKPGKLNEVETAEMRRHSELGYRISKSIPELGSIADLILKHHERWDGKGYPLGIGGLDIPMECRILAIVDAFDAMTHDRPYRNAMPVAFAIEELKGNSGTQFDARLVEEFLGLLAEKQRKGLW